MEGRQDASSGTDPGVYRYGLVNVTTAILASAQQLDRRGLVLLGERGARMGSEAADMCAHIAAPLELPSAPIFHSLLDTLDFVTAVMDDHEQPGAALLACLREVLEQFADVTFFNQKMPLRETLIAGVMKSLHQLEKLGQLGDPDDERDRELHSKARMSSLAVLLVMHRALLSDDDYYEWNTFKIIRRLTRALEELAYYSAGQPIEQFAATTFRALLEGYKTYYASYPDSEVQFNENDAFDEATLPRADAYTAAYFEAPCAIGDEYADDGEKGDGNTATGTAMGAAFTSNTNKYSFVLSRVAEALISSETQMNQFGRALHTQLGAEMGSEAAHALQLVQRALAINETLSSLEDTLLMVIGAMEAVKEPGIMVTCMKDVLRQFASVASVEKGLSLEAILIRGALRSIDLLERRDYRTTEQEIDEEGTFNSKVRRAVLRAMLIMYKGVPDAPNTHLQVISQVTNYLEMLADYAQGLPIEQFVATGIRALLEGLKYYNAMCPDTKMPARAKEDRVDDDVEILADIDVKGEQVDTAQVKEEQIVGKQLAKEPIDADQSVGKEVVAEQSKEEPMDAEQIVGKQDKGKQIKGKLDEVGQNEGEQTDAELIDIEEIKGAKTEGGKAEGEKAEGEKAEGEKAEGEKADGEKAEAEKAEGEKTEEEKAAIEGQWSWWNIWSWKN